MREREKERERTDVDGHARLVHQRLTESIVFDVRVYV